MIKQKEEILDRICTLFNVDKNSRGNISVCCPLHSDLRNSASLNLDKGVFQCFAECTNGKKKGFTLEQLIERIDSGEIMEQKKVIDMEWDDSDVTENNHETLLPANKKTLQQFLKKRGLNQQTFKQAGAYPVFDKAKDNYGYLVFPYNHSGYVARSFIGHSNRYLNHKGEKTLYGFDSKQDEVFLVEGIFDLLSLRELGYKNVVCSLGSSLSKQQAYLLRKKVVYIIFDSDYAGWHGAIETSKLLFDVGANPIIIELPEVENKNGNKLDINELYISNKKELKKCIDKTLAKYNTNDQAYVKRLFTGKEDKLTMFSTGIKEIDDLHNGGYLEGMLTIQAETEQGKSTLALGIAKNTAENGAKVLYETNEISIRQCWSRVAASYSAYSWDYLEMHPERLEKHAREKAEKLAENLKIVSGWSLAEIKKVSKNYDMIVIDYIQRMPGFTQDARTNINLNLNGLSDIARDEAKIVLNISSISRANYGSEDNIGASKDSGNIEYMTQCLVQIRKLDANHMSYNILKNTRSGVKGNSNFFVDYGHLHFGRKFAPRGK